MAGKAIPDTRGLHACTISSTLRSMRLQVVTFTCDRSETAIYQGLARAGIEIDIICSPRAPARAALEESGLRLSFLDVRHRLDLRAARTCCTRRVTARCRYP